jgi:hypothetical protein
MFARSIAIEISGRLFHTPLLIPSFSSKASIELNKIFEIGQEFITDYVLVSAYDIHNQHLIPPNYPFAELVFLDSGGYEVSKDVELWEAVYQISEPKPWSREFHQAVLTSWSIPMPTVIVSYDHPTLRQPLPDQIATARSLFAQFPEFTPEFLIKPETPTQQYIRIESVIENLNQIAEFPIIGLTEKELGGSLLHRMTSVAKIRREMDRLGIIKPIHIFGSLDPISTPLYFLSGADMFDGLAWLRYSFYEGLTVHIENGTALAFGLNEHYRRALARGYSANLNYLHDLRAQMRRYLLKNDLSQFTHHTHLFRQAIDDLSVALGEG